MLVGEAVFFTRGLVLLLGIIGWEERRGVDVGAVQVQFHVDAYAAVVAGRIVDVQVGDVEFDQAGFDVARAGGSGAVLGDAQARLLFGVDVALQGRGDELPAVGGELVEAVGFVVVFVG